MQASDATLRCGEARCEVTYVGRGAWIVDGKATAADQVVAAIRAGLALVPPFAVGTRIEAQTATRRGVIANNTYPPTAWWFHVDLGSDGVADDLDAAIAAGLESLELAPASPVVRRAFDEPRWSAAALAEAPEIGVFAEAFGQAIAAWLGPDARGDAVAALLEGLRALGHKLVRYDDDGGEWATFGLAPGRLQVTIRLHAYQPPWVGVESNGVCV